MTTLPLRYILYYIIIMPLHRKKIYHDNLNLTVCYNITKKYFERDIHNIISVFGLRNGHVRDQRIRHEIIPMWFG